MREEGLHSHEKLGILQRIIDLGTEMWPHSRDFDI